MKYSLRRQLEKGERWEKYLDSLFVDNFSIRPATRQQQRQGIDRIFTHKLWGTEYRIEYKADKTAARTGNAFIETTSVDTWNKPGWALTCQSDFLIYYIVGIGPAYILRPRDIKANVSEWQGRYPERKIPNKGYHTVGLLVPLAELERFAVAVHPA